jgi:bifunctional non-homologous end joining protein LigD
MPFISPMLAKPMRDIDFTNAKDPWYAEEKFDGHRLIVEKTSAPSDLFSESTVMAWSRYGLPRILPSHVRAAVGEMPDGIYDGELITPGERSYNVTELTKTDKLVFMCFDVLQLLGEDTTEHRYVHRRTYLEEIFSREHIQVQQRGVRLALNTLIESKDQLIELRDTMWARKGEGLILKRGYATYRPGKRSADFIKIKDLQTAVLRVVGFEPSRGEIINRGPYAVVLLEDEDGHQVTVKTRNDEEIAKLEKEASNLRSCASCSGTGYRGIVKSPCKVCKTSGVDPHRAHRAHPAIGRKLRIEFQERTPDGSYRHPRWDRWENE